jgi:hypothetical protein
LPRLVSDHDPPTLTSFYSWNYRHEPLYPTIMWCGEVLFWSYLFGVLKASWTRITIFFSRLGKFSVVTLLNVFSMPLAYPSSSMPWFIVLVF